MKNAGTVEDNWKELRRYTAARLALGRSGVSLPTAALLRFRMDHALARDAATAELDIPGMKRKLAGFEMRVLALSTAARSREEYIARPDRGKVLSEKSRLLLKDAAGPCDVCLVIADGLSSRAVEENSVPLLDELVPGLAAGGFAPAPLCIVSQGRVAIGDEIGHLLGARMSVVLIGERPGLSAPRSMGIYLTYLPEPGLTDERRNCISNVRPEGLAPAAAAAKLLYLVGESFRKKISGVALKDEADTRRIR